MAKRGRKRRKLTLGEAALRGACAGLAGGAAVMLARRLEDKHFRRRRLIQPGAAADPEWGELASSAGGRLGARLSGGGRTAAGVGLHLAYSALLGALFGMVQSRADDLPSNLSDILEDVLLLAAGAPRHRLRPRHVVRKTGKGNKSPLVPVSGSNVFGAATAAAFRALLRV